MNLEENMMLSCLRNRTIAGVIGKTRVPPVWRRSLQDASKKPNIPELEKKELSEGHDLAEEMRRDKANDGSSASSGSKQNHSFNSRGPVTFASLSLVALVAAGCVAYYNFEKEKKVEKVTGNITHIGRPALGGPWTLVDHNGIIRLLLNYLSFPIISS